MTGDDRLMFEDSGFLKRLAQVYRQANMRQKRTIKQNALNYDMMHTINWKIPLDKIDKKIHFMYGKEDRSIGDGSKYMAEQIQNGVKHEFENYGHFLAYRKKEYIFELITQEL